MRFLITAGPCGNDATKGSEGPFDEALFAAYMAYNEEMTKAGVLIAAEGLKPNGLRVRVALEGGKRRVVDGPFTETKELLGGLYLIECDSEEEAIGWALRVPAGHGKHDVLEIRQLTELSDLEPRVQALIAKAAPQWSSRLWRTEKPATRVDPAGSRSKGR